MKICIVDDDKLVALSLKTILEANADIQVCGLGENGKDAIDLFHQYQPDVLLMDIRMSEMTGLEAAEQLLVEDSSRKILLLTTFSDDEYIIKALNLGVKGYILKQNFESIVPALSAVQTRRRFYHRRGHPRGRRLQRLFRGLTAPSSRKNSAFTENLQTPPHTLWYTVDNKTFGRACYGQVY